MIDIGSRDSIRPPRQRQARRVMGLWLIAASALFVVIGSTASVATTKPAAIRLSTAISIGSKALRVSIDIN